LLPRLGSSIAVDVDAYTNVRVVRGRDVAIGAGNHEGLTRLAGSEVLGQVDLDVKFCAFLLEDDVTGHKSILPILRPFGVKEQKKEKKGPLAPTFICRRTNS
jgi:hypothetical protein